MNCLSLHVAELVRAEREWDADLLTSALSDRLYGGFRREAILPVRAAGVDEIAHSREDVMANTYKSDDGGAYINLWFRSRVGGGTLLPNE